MAKWYEIQRDFSGGEISQRMFMRDDLEVHGKACLTMENFMPTLQGSAMRTPGTRYLWEIKTAADAIDLDARIFPYITPNGQYALVEILPDRGAGGDLRIRQNLQDAIDGIPTSGGLNPDASQIIFRQIVENWDFRNGSDGWTLIDPEYTGGRGDTLGWVERNNSLRGTARIGETNSAADQATCTITTTATLPENTDQVVVNFSILYANNFSDVNQSKISGKVTVTSPGGTEGDIYELDISKWDVGQRERIVQPVPYAGTAADELELKFTFTAIEDDGIGSTPNFVVNSFGLQSKVTADVSTVQIQGGVPYSPSELKDVHYIQSPYYNSGDGGGTFGNELVFTHPKHPPKRLIFSPIQGGYVFQTIPFNYDDGSGGALEWTSVWATGGYPATCTSYLGRLVLAGSDASPVLGSLSGSLTERVWMTKVGKWNQVTPSTADQLPDSSIEFTSTYRSPIQWVHGQTNLLVGSESYEYVSNTDGIYSPGDLGVFLQSTHGSEKVQPVPMGQYVLFAAEQGSRVRAMQYIAESEYWVSPDVTHFHPELFAKGGGIKRMARMRNPHQMCVCVMGNGQLAVLHQDSYINVSAWSRINMGNQVRDIVVLPQEDGTDVLYMLVERNVEGTERLYLEAIADWTYRQEDNWFYTNTTVSFIPTAATNVITGLDHLNNRIVQVVSNGSFLGSWRVNNGSITLLDGTGQPINVGVATIGQAMGARLRTMPVITQDPGSQKRYSSLYVRTRNSSRPLINRTRPADRDAQRVLDEAQDLDIVWDNETEVFDWNRTQIVEVSENLPVRTEVLGIYGTIKGNSVA